MAFHYIIFGRSFLLLACITCLFGYKVTALDTTIQGLKNTSITETTIVVQWAESSFTNFTVSYTNGSTKVEKNVTSNIWKIENLLPGVNYNITVSSWNATYSGPGSTISVTTLPSVVTGLKASNASTHAVDVSWNTPSDKNENTYTYNLVVQGPRGKNQTNVKGNITEVPNLEPGTYYNFTVSAVTNNGVSSNPSDVANVTTLPSVVTGLKASNASTHAVDVSWNTPSDPNVNTYTYNLVVQGPHGKNQTNVKGNMTTVQNLEPGTYYSFTVSAVTNNGVSSNPSDADNATTLPSVVTGLKVSNISTNEVTVSWNTSSDPNENTYRYSLVVQGPRWKNITYVQGNSTVVQNLEPGTVYNFTISAVTNNNVSSKPSEVVSATTLPSAVTGLKVSNVSTNAVTVSWNTSSDPNENTYSYSLVVQGWGNKIDVQGNSTFVQNLEPGTVYNFTVSAVTNNNVSSKPSEVVSATTWPSIVTGLNISNISTEEVTVSWNTTGDPNGNTYTYILKVQGPHFVKEIKVIGNNTIVKALDPGTDYNFTVSAVTNNNVSSKPSDVVSATTSPSIVENFTVIDKTNQSFFLNWTMPNNTYVSTYTYTVELWSNGTHNGTFSNIKDHFKQVDYLLAGETYNITIYTVTINGIRSFQNPIIMDTTLPNEPQSLSVNATDITEIFIDWMSPRDVHASLYEYIVEWNNVNLIGKQGQNTTRDTQFNIKSLYPGNLYKITVTSVFKNTFSIQAVENVQTNPVSAQNFIVLTTTNTTATLQWDQPNYDNSKVDGYRVIGWKNGNSLVYNETTKKQTFVVDGLQPGYIYKFSVESFARNEIPPKKRSLSQMDLNWISYSIPKTATGETVPDAVLNPTCSKVDGYQIKVEFRCPLGNYSQIQVLVNNKRYNRSCPGSDKISDLQPAQEYAVKIITFGTDKSADTIITCYTDSTGVIVGSVLGILLFLLLIGLIVFFVFRKRRSKSNSEHIQISTRRRRFHTITKERFKQHYDNNHANSDLGFAEEYQELSSVGILQSKKAAELSDNKAKNRFTNVLPYDHSRVKLITINDTANTDYINANFMPGYNSTKEFIASQGPLPNTTADFWRMVWEHHVNTIVMLTNCMENGRVKCERYWPLDYTPCTYGDITVTVTSETILPEWTTRDFSIKHANQTGLHNVRHFHFTAWPDHGVPDSTSSIMQFRNLVREYMDQRRSNGPTVVHCSAGVGRTGTLIALDYLIQQMEREHRIGVFSCVEKMRMNRGLMVQTEEQYIFLNKCLLDLIEQPPEENIYENQVPTDLIYENATAIRNFQRENA